MKLHILGRIAFITLLSCTCAFAQRNKGGKRGGGGGKKLAPDIAVLRPTAKDGPAAIELALKTKDPHVAIAALGNYMRNTDGLTSAATIRNLARFSAKKDYACKTGLLLSLKPQWSSVVEALLKAGDEDAQRLAAAVLAARAYGDHLDAELNSRPGKQSENNPGPMTRRGRGVKKGKGKGKQAGAAAAPGAVSVPASLVASKDAQTRKLAIMAAAYAGDKSVAQAVLAEKRKGFGQTGAVELFYAAMTGTDVPGSMIADVLKRVQRPKGAIDRVSPKFSVFTFDIPDACFLCQALGALGKEQYLPTLEQLAAVKDVRVRADAVRAMRDIGSPKSLAFLAKLATTCSWPVLIEVCQALSAMPDKRVGPALIQRLAEEKGRMRLDIVHALSCIAGEQHGETAEEWKEWWVKNQADFEVDTAASATFRKKTRVQDVNVPGNGFFYGLTVYSDRMCYCVDSSASMKGDRIEALRESMKGSVDSLKEHVMFNICNFGGEVIIMYPQAMSDDKRDGHKHIEEMDLSYGTRTMDAMEQTCLIPGMDTIYFLSDGAPVQGQTQIWHEISAVLRVINRYRPVAVFMVGFKPSASNRKAMQGISNEHYGREEPNEV